MGKGALFARRAHRRGLGGHAEPVIGPAEGRTRWLCPPCDYLHAIEVGAGDEVGLVS